MRFSLRSVFALGSIVVMGAHFPLEAVDAPKKLMRPIKKLVELQQKNVQKRVVSKNAAEWTIVAYIQADNNLAPFAVYNINDMQLASLPSSINMLVEWDQPNNKKTWRYRIVNGGRIEDASLSSEMGTNPVQEIIDMMRWAKSKYEAKHYCTILWNHGAGVIDPRFKHINKTFRSGLTLPTTKPSLPWLQVPGLGLRKQAPKDPRGILFDDSQDTYATNQDLTRAFDQIKKDLGTNVDIVGMDACLMAMLEVGYQIKDSVNVLVASQQTEPGEGWAYSGFLKPLSANPAAFGAFDLATAIVGAYGNFYKSRARDYTQSAVDLSKLEAVKNNVSQLVAAIAECKKADRLRTKRAVLAARRASIAFDVADYIDLASFYTGLVTQFKKRDGDFDKKSFGAFFADIEDRIAGKPTKSYTKAVAALNAVIASGLQLIEKAVIANDVGPKFSKAKGISVYYPKGSIHSSYKDTLFAQKTTWDSFIQEYR